MPIIIMQKLENGIKSFFDENCKFCILVSVIIMLITHAFCFMNTLYAHDSLFFYNIEALDKVGYGRFLYPFYVRERLMATPWFVGVLCILFITLSIIFVVKIFDFSKEQSFCVVVLFTTNISLISLFTAYIFDADVDCLALLFSCFSVYAFKTFPRGINILVSSVSLAICLAIYQSYICVSVTLFLLLLLSKANNSYSWKEVVLIFKDGLLELLTIMVAVITYFLSLNYVSRYFGIGFSTGYNGVAKLGELTFLRILNAIPDTYESVREYFFNITPYSTLTVVRINYFVLFVIAATLIIFVYQHKRFLGALLIVIPVLFLLPLGVSAIYLVSFGAMHHLMMFAYNLLFLVPLVLIQNKEGASLKNIKLYLKRAITLCIFLLCINNIRYANGAYTHQKLVYDNTLIHAQSIWKDINSIEGYVEGETPVVFVGNFEGSNIVYYGPAKEGYTGVLLGAVDTAITYNPSIYFYGILGRKMNIVYDDSLSNNEECSKMEKYPKNGYIKIIDDRVVVKISD